MTVELAVAMAMFVGLVAYAVFGGADFGSGFYDLTAGGAAHGAELRTEIDHSIGPVWEANHVWLIYVLVMWWTGFPTAFAAAMSTLILPLLLALLGIVLRGAGFAFRKFSPTLSQARVYGSLFAGSSLIAPFFLGTVAGAVASGRVPADGQGDRWSSWLNPTSLLVGVITVACCTFLAGSFLTADATRAGHRSLAAQLRRRTLLVGAVAGALVLGSLVPIARDAPTLAEGLTGRAAPLIVSSILGGMAALVLLLRRRVAAARVSAVIAVASVVVGWGAAQYPWLLVDEVTIADAAGAPATLRALLLVAALAGVIVIPSLVYLFRLTQSEQWAQG
ncbi:cytochrome d ubiquinol oxidase subunit II [Promicromonospora iranensis]|uniref:Cytochrome d ubiquinol oxidase subunit II n=1 Tax=Promicromonospora iranensis TaxID=1105144 RepID=A0ABU2CUQ6_9MICO|nr:cytochrome d ubiquinol oxidase subunit II [Promicromonospora iranensis]MDR7385073.1 cytochrome d ubiquinol oxidase subunit II [Promicromonospora iranensis]